MSAGSSAHEPPVLSAVAIRPLHILLAEDSIFNQKVAVGMLAMARHTVTVANNGREAVEAFARQPFDLVFMDLQMPEMDGKEATQRIRRQQEMSGMRVPIIAMTAHAMAGDREKCLAAGMDDYVSKPISRDELAAVVARNTTCCTGVSRRHATVAAMERPPLKPQRRPGAPVPAKPALTRTDVSWSRRQKQGRSASAKT